MTGKYDFDTPVNRTGSGSVKWDTGRRIFGGGDNFLPMWIADTDFKTLPEITKAVEERLSHPLFGYITEPNEFFTSFQSWMERRHNFSIPKEAICPADGVVTAIALSLNAFTKEGDEIVVNTPCYDNFYKVIEQNNRVVKKSELKHVNGRFEINFEDMENCFKSGARTLLFCNPHNPSGRVWREDELKKVAELVKKYGILVISDDIHSEITSKSATYLPLIKVAPEISDQCITCYSTGKVFNTAAVKSATIIITDETKRMAFKNWQERIFQLKLNVFSYCASIAAYTYGDDYVDDLREYIEGNAKYIVDYLTEKAPAIKCYNPEGTYLMFWDCTALGMSGRELVSFFTKNADVAFSGGSSYGENYGAWVRVNLATSRENIKKAMDRVAAALNR